MIDQDDYQIDKDYPARRRRVSNFIGWVERDMEGWIWMCR